jgi:hypothetical protein
LGSNRTFAYNSGAAIAGTEQVGYIAVGLEGSRNYGAVTWWPGPDEDLRYIICHTSGERTAAQGTIPVAAPTIGFWGSTLKTEASFVTLCNSIFPGNAFTTGYDAALYLGDNGYWTSYPPIGNADALAYYEDLIAAGATIGYTTALALDTLFTDLQNTELASGGVYLYDVLEGFYPMLGLTSATQAINGNGNSTYDLQFAGGWIFNSLGMQGNGINTYAYTGKQYTGNTGNELDNTHFSIYGTVPNNTPSNGDLSVSGSISRWVTITLNRIGAGTGRYEYDCGSGSDSAPNLNSGDFVTISTQGGTTYAYENGSAPTPSSAGSISFFNDIASLYLGVSVNVSCSPYVGHSVNTFGWSSFGGFMETTDMGNYQTIVNAFMASIGRNTY